MGIQKTRSDARAKNPTYSPPNPWSSHSQRVKWAMEITLIPISPCDCETIIEQASDQVASACFFECASLRRFRVPCIEPARPPQAGMRYGSSDDVVYAERRMEALVRGWFFIGSAKRC